MKRITSLMAVIIPALFFIPSVCSGKITPYFTVLEDNFYDAAVCFADDSDGGYAVLTCEGGEISKEYYKYRFNTVVRKIDRDGRLVWKKYILTPDRENPQCIATDGRGGYVISGIVGDVTVKDVFMIKIDGNGNVEWKRRYDNSYDFKPAGICAIPDGFAITGQVDAGNSGPRKKEGMPGDYHVFITDFSGNLLFQQKYFDYLSRKEHYAFTEPGAFVYDDGSTVSCVSGKEKYIIKHDVYGREIWRRALDTGTEPLLFKNNNDGFTVITDNIITRYDTKGSVKWKYSCKHSIITADIETKSGRVYAAGKSDGVYMLCLDSNGKAVWESKAGDDGVDPVMIKAAGEGSCAVLCSTITYSAARLAERKNAIIFRTNESGLMEGTDAGRDPRQGLGKTYGNSAKTTAADAVSLDNGGFLIAGTSNLFGKGEADIYLMETDAEGNCINSRAFISGDDVVVKALCKSDDGGFVISGARSGLGGMKPFLYKVNKKYERVWDYKPDFTGCYNGVIQTGGGYYAAGGYKDVLGNKLTKRCHVLLDKSGKVIVEKTYNDAAGAIFCVNKTYSGKAGLLGTFIKDYETVTIVTADISGNTVNTEEAYIYKGYDPVRFIAVDDGQSVVTGKTDGHVILLKTKSAHFYDDTFKLKGSGRYIDRTAEGGYIVAASVSEGDGKWNDAGLVRYDINGNAIWYKTYGTPGNDEPCFVKSMDNGDYLMIGMTMSEDGTSSIFILRADNKGVKIW